MSSLRFPTCFRAGVSTGAPLETVCSWVLVGAAAPLVVTSPFGSRLMRSGGRHRLCEFPLGVVQLVGSAELSTWSYIVRFSRTSHLLFGHS